MLQKKLTLFTLRSLKPERIWLKSHPENNEKWVKDRRAIVEKLSNGRIGYLHIKAMDQPSLARFRKDLGDNRTKEALVIDQR